MLLSMSCCTVASFVRLLRLVNCLFIFMAASSKFVSDAIKGCIHVCGDGKGRKIQPRPVEHNFRHKAVVLRVTFKNIMLKFWSIMYLTLRRVLRGQLFSPKGKFNYLKVFFQSADLVFSIRLISIADLFAVRYLWDVFNKDDCCIVTHRAADILIAPLGLFTWARIACLLQLLNQNKRSRLLYLGDAQIIKIS